MNIRPIRTEQDYDWALSEIAKYFEREPKPDHVLYRAGTFEATHWPIGPSADPVAAIRFRMDQRGYTQADLGRLLGSRSRASEILSGSRALTTVMIEKLHREWGIPAAALLGSGAAPVKRSRRATSKRTSLKSRGARAA